MITRNIQNALLLAVLLSPLLAAQNSTPPTHALRAGAATVDITPPVEPFEDRNKNLRHDAGEPFEDLNRNQRFDPIWLGGFGKGRAANRINDPLWARAIVLADSNNVQIALVVVDLVGLLHVDCLDISQAVERAHGIPAQNVIIGSTHNHHGPDTLGLWGPRFSRTGATPSYRARVRNACTRAIGEASNRLTPVQVRSAQISDGVYLRDSRKPAVTDPILRAIRFEIPGSDRAVASLFVYSCHPEVLWSKNQALTSDFPHYLRNQVESDSGGIALFWPGVIGGLQTPRVAKKDFAHAEKMGRHLAQRGLEALSQASIDPVKSIEIRHRRVLWPIDNKIFRLAIALGVLPGGDRLEYPRPGILGRIGARPFIPSRLFHLRLGPIEIVTIPGELFPELGKTIRQSMTGRNRILLGLTDGMVGYILPADQWTAKGYEESMSIGKETGPRLIEDMRALISTPPR
ncbi:MAG: hypothetical protein QF752_04905 [Planctomycetota bacterium]|jgi:hypothetical protein|nr:hypothetical protein [Planctomycetota bacterium]